MTFHITRIDAQAGATSGLVCILPEQPLAVTVFDDATGISTTTNICVDTSSTHPCVLPDLLRAAGHEPADWDVECP